MPDDVMPLRSRRRHRGPFGSGLVLHDAARSEVHVINGPAALVWERCDGTSPIGGAADDLATITGHARDEIEQDVRSHLAALRTRGSSVGGHRWTTSGRRSRSWWSSPWPRRCSACSTTGWWSGRTAPRCRDHLVEVFATLVRPGPVTADIGVHVDADGAVRVYGRGHDLTLGPDDALDDVVASLVNRVVAAATAPLALHAGAVRWPPARSCCCRPRRDRARAR